MVLKCPECHGWLRVLAGYCPHCGCTAVRKNRSVLRKAYSVLVVSEAAALLYLLTLLYR